MTTEEEAVVKRQFWPSEWARSEAFWRDVTSRALAGLIVVVMGAGLAAAFGFIDWKEFGRGLSYCVAVIGGICLGLQLLTGTVVPIFKRAQRIKNDFARGVALVLATLSIGLPIFGVVGVCIIAFPYIASW